MDIMILQRWNLSATINELDDNNYRTGWADICLTRDETHRRRGDSPERTVGIFGEWLGIHFEAHCLYSHDTGFKRRKSESSTWPTAHIPIFECYWTFSEQNTPVDILKFCRFIFSSLGRNNKRWNGLQPVVGSLIFLGNIFNRFSYSMSGIYR